MVAQICGVTNYYLNDLFLLNKMEPIPYTARVNKNLSVAWILIGLNHKYPESDIWINAEKSEKQSSQSLVLTTKKF